MVKRYRRIELPYSGDDTLRRFRNANEEYIRRNADRFYWAGPRGVGTIFSGPFNIRMSRRLNARATRSIATLRRSIPGMYRRYRRNRNRAMTGLLQRGVTPYNLRQIRSYL